jgi:NADPH2:quinone reductase
MADAAYDPLQLFNPIGVVTMKAIRVHEPGGPEVMRLEDVPVPSAQAGQVLVRVSCAGINYSDVYQRSGLNATPMPFIPGVEGSGIAETTAGAVKSGMRVAWAGSPGAYAEMAVVPAWKLVPLPDSLDDRAGAAALMQGMTAQYLCESTFAVSRGHVALVHAGAGGVGLLLIQLLKFKGATVITTVSTPEKAQLAQQAGADHCVLYRDVDFASAVRDLTHGKGVDVVYDAVGKTTFAGSLSVLRPFGMLVLYGQSSGKVPPVEPMDLCKQGSVHFVRPMLAHYIADEAALRERAGRVLRWIEQGVLKLRIAPPYPLAEAARAHRDLESRATVGKLLLEVHA